MGGSEGPSDEAPGLSAPSGVVHDITMPKLGETVTEGTIGSWLKQVGDAVAFDDALFEVSTDKVDSEIPSPYDGVLLEILVAAGETVPIGTPLARIGEEGAAPGAASGSTPLTPGSAAAPAAAGAPTGNGEARGATASVAAEPGRMLSPLVRRLAAENSVDLSTVAGTGVGGRIRREDIQGAIAAGGHDGRAASAGRAHARPPPPRHRRPPRRPRRPAPRTRATRWCSSRGCGWRSPRE